MLSLKAKIPLHDYTLIIRINYLNLPNSKLNRVTTNANIVHLY